MALWDEPSHFTDYCRIDMSPDDRSWGPNSPSARSAVCGWHAVPEDVIFSYELLGTQGPRYHATLRPDRQLTKTRPHSVGVKMVFTLPTTASSPRLPALRPILSKAHGTPHFAMPPLRDPAGSGPMRSGDYKQANRYPNAQPD